MGYTDLHMICLLVTMQLVGGKLCGRALWYALCVYHCVSLLIDCVVLSEGMWTLGRTQSAKHLL